MFTQVWLRYFCGTCPTVGVVVIIFACSEWWACGAIVYGYFHLINSIFSCGAKRLLTLLYFVSGELS